MLGGSGLRHELAGLGIDPRPLEDHAPVEARQVLRVGQPDVDDGHAAGCEVLGEGHEGRTLGRPVREHEDRVEGDEGEPEPAGVRQAQPDEVRLDEGQVLGRDRPGQCGTRLGPREHRWIEIDGRDPVATGRQGHGQAPGPGRELEDRPAGPLGQGEIEVEVARIVDEIEVVETRQVVGRGPIADAERVAVDGSALPADPGAGLAFERERADRLECGAVRRHGGGLGLVVRRRDLHDVHAGQLDGADDLADRPQDLARQHPARLRRARPGRHARIDDVDVDREVDDLGAVERLGDRIGDDSLGAALLDLAHEMPAQPVFLHPVERLLGRPVAAQAHLHEVAPIDGARLDEPAHRRAVAGEDPERLVGRVGVGVEVDDADPLGRPELGDRGRRRPGDGVVAAEDDRDRPAARHVPDLAVDHRVRPLDP